MPSTSEEQYLLELINEARINPLANAARYISSFTPLASADSRITDALKFYQVNGTALFDALKNLQTVGVLAWNDSLSRAAESHSGAMIAADEQSHQVKGELDLAGRYAAAGYTGFTTGGENVYAYGLNLIYAHAGFMVDWGEGPNGMQSPAGHRVNIMSAAFTEVGIDVSAERDARTKVGPYIVTEDFGSCGKLYITGVAYQDGDKNSFYTIGEGTTGLTVSSGRSSVTTTVSGGYSLEAVSGTNTFTLSGGLLTGAVTVTTTISNESLKLDVVNGNTLLTNGSIAVVGPVDIIKVIGLDGASVTSGTGFQDLRGADGNDRLDAGDGDDLLSGGRGNDELLGSAGKDQLTGGEGDDMIDGGAGVDIAFYSGTRSTYTLSSRSDGSIVVAGGREGADTLRNVEFLTFSDGQFSLAQMGQVSNRAPEVQAKQALALNTGTTKQFTVAATDADGDPLTYTPTSAAHGKITDNGRGAFTYTPNAGYTGADSFSITVSDGKGGASTQAITVDIKSNNSSPTANASQNLSMKQDGVKQISVIALDPDGDQLTYLASTAKHGVISQGVGGAFTYTPAKGYVGTDKFDVTVTDGKGGSVVQTVNLAISAVAPPNGEVVTGAPYRLFTPNGFTDAIGGTGTVTGTNGFQDITVLPQSGSVSFDASFNRGGDIIRLPGNASGYDIELDGSTAKLLLNGAIYSIPVGGEGVSLVFADGVRKLYFDQSGIAKLGSQTFGDLPAPIVAASDNTPLPTGQDSGLAGRVFLSSGGAVSLDGDHVVFGTAGKETVSYLGGDLHLDASFNRGGDTLVLSKGVASYEAYLSGSTVVLVSEDGSVTIPFGEVGMSLNFAGETLTLRYDAATKQVLIGNAPITSLSGNDPDPIYEGPLHSLDVGTPSAAATLDLNSGSDYVLTDDARITSNVIINGFDDNDVIEVIGVAASEYNFANTDADRDGSYGDLIITYNTNSVVNIIAITDAFSANTPVYDLASAQAAMGGEFITFG